MTRHPERDERVITMWNKGLTSGQISKHLDITRNVVIGVVQRMRAKGFEVRSKTREEIDWHNGKNSRANRQQRYFNTPYIPYMKRKSKPLPSLDDKDTACIGPTIEQLKPHHCRWPLWGEKDKARRYCGRRKEKYTDPYCPHHEHRSRR